MDGGGGGVGSMWSIFLYQINIAIHILLPVQHRRGHSRD